LKIKCKDFLNLKQIFANAKVLKFKITKCVFERLLRYSLHIIRYRRSNTNSTGSWKIENAGPELECQASSKYNNSQKKKKYSAGRGAKSLPFLKIFS
jgi:hypothetical protein